MLRCCVAFVVVAVSACLVSGCEDEGCLAGDTDSCVVPSPCSRLTFRCDGGFTAVEVLASGDPRPGGADALSSPGDFVLRNDRVVAVVDALDHPHYIAPTGGTLLDLVPATGGQDALNHVFQATGLLPGDAVHYDRARVLEDGTTRAVQVTGHLDGHPDQRVATRYEIRPCEPGIRVRTEVVNLEPEPAVWTVTDGWYWGGRSNMPFAPFQGGGFAHPEVKLTDLVASFRPVPYLATLPPLASAPAYACIPCNVSTLDGFHTDDVSAMGLAPRIVQPRDFEVFERFIAVAGAGSAGPAIDVALDARRQLFGERWVRLSGRITAERAGITAAETRATIQVSEGRARDARPLLLPRTQVTPDSAGRFTVRVPANRDYVVQVHAFGRPAATVEVDVGAEDAVLDDIDIDPVSLLTVTVRVDGDEDHALVFVHPADEETRTNVVGDRFGQQGRCAPLLGPAHGGSPACNRVLVDGTTSVQLLPGRYDVYATAGPFTTLARREVSLAPGGAASVEIDLTRLPLQPPGTLTADLHVHGAVSFDSSIPDLDRVQAFLASGIQVLASTDHDLVHAYADAMAALGADARMHLIPGLETTGHILFDLVPGSDFPQVIGHWNFWPLTPDADGPWRGAPWDELAEPGLLFTRVEDMGWPSATGVAQLNHPWDPSDFGRDLGFPRAIGLSALEPLPGAFDGTSQGLLFHRPEGARFASSDYHVQEVMNGSANAEHLAYRALWFYFLDEGFVRGGTANSDSHDLSGSVLGTPRNVVWTDTTMDRFDAGAFNADVRAGHIVGTNGPIIEVEATDSAGMVLGPSTASFAPSADAMLRIRVSAAPWVPVEEVRIVVNGSVARTLRDELTAPSDPFGTDGLVRFEGTLALADLLPGRPGDAWLVVEAGAPLMAAADLDCDGIPDTGDNDGDGVIDARDVDVDPTGTTPVVPVEAVRDGCVDDTGPLRRPPVPVDRDAPGHIFEAVVPRGQPAAFTNPLLLDLDGGGWAGVMR